MIWFEPPISSFLSTASAQTFYIFLKYKGGSVGHLATCLLKGGQGGFKGNPNCKQLITILKIQIHTLDEYQIVKFLLENGLK